MYPQIGNFWCWLALIPFVVVAIIHLVHCSKQLLGLSDITKFMLMPLLILMYAVWTFMYSDTIALINIFVLVALIALWVGDILLIYDWERPSFVHGILMFLLAQIAYIAAGIILIMNFTVPVIAALILLIVYIVIITIKLIIVRHDFRGLGRFAVVYMISVGIMSYLFLLLAIANPNTASILMAVGGILFMLSDSHVIEEYFVGGYKQSHFWIMLAYLLAQFLIVLGFIGMQGVIA
ncbi:MAG: hypothetical protein CR988_03370 [Treponema sp.]|nr:MAG: hypothetical protein CR988_03370 [Treponema sp.]